MKILSGSSLILLNLLFSVTVLADPTRPAPGWQADNSSAAATVQTAGPTLQLIKQTADGRVALISGQLVRKGGVYQQYQVLDIQEKQVVLQRNGEQRVLRLLNTAIKQYED